MAAMLCEICKKVEFPETAEYCPGCGAIRHPPVCSRCGADADFGEAACPKCGQSLRGEGPAAPAAPAAPSAAPAEPRTPPRPASRVMRRPGSRTSSVLRRSATGSFRPVTGRGGTTRTQAGGRPGSRRHGGMPKKKAPVALIVGIIAVVLIAAVVAIVVLTSKG